MCEGTYTMTYFTDHFYPEQTIVSGVRQIKHWLDTNVGEQVTVLRFNPDARITGRLRRVIHPTLDLYFIRDVSQDGTSTMEVKFTLFDVLKVHHEPGGVKEITLY